MLAAIFPQTLLMILGSIVGCSAMFLFLSRLGLFMHDSDRDALKSYRQWRKATGRRKR